MRSILALSLLIGLCGVANAAPAHHSHRHAVVRSDQGTFAPGSASSFAYAPSWPPTESRSADPCDKPEAYYGACQGYAPGEKERFLGSLHGP
ncbi:hypothetical protein [Bradyrhizobium sp. CCGUVB14]|uniref:hypothetical protein n=1 Tax=Bradyrhizobium sp. CCGUVB14 TaxID=2949628 RepID=UPI0020B24186|nr:hypothetical protein [Bradyrhizobium sp. CCGUVB14]MCP3441872.1 hypothetical protein [Bradyrhizobium sp. CCGUVB14]